MYVVPVHMFNVIRVLVVHREHIGSPKGYVNNRGIMKFMSGW